MIQIANILVLSLTVVLTAVAMAPAEVADSASGANNPPQVISIERLRSDSAGSFDTLEVTIGPEYAADGFDFKVATDSRSISIIDILPGELIDSCRWKYFNARAMPLPVGESRLTAIWQVVALAEMFTSGDTVLCRRFDRDVSVIEIALAPKVPRPPEDTAAAVFFYWEDCTDNTLAIASGNMLSVSREVVDYFELAWPDTGGQFPTHRGILPTCIGAKAQGRILPRLIFQNGGVHLPPKKDRPDEDSLGSDTALSADTSG